MEGEGFKKFIGGSFPHNLFAKYLKVIKGSTAMDIF